MDLDEATNFVCEIVQSERLDTTAKAGCFPFERSAVEYIVSQIVAITPRKVIKAMHDILEEVRLCDHDPSKNGPITREILDDFNIIEEVMGL